MKKGSPQDTIPHFNGTQTYRVNLLGIIPAGKLVINPEKTDERYPGFFILTAAAETLPWLQSFYPAKASLYSRIQSQTLAPVEFTQTISLHGKKESVKKILYDQDQGIMTLEGQQRTIPLQTQDPLSLLNNLRNMNLSSTKSFEYTINTNQKNYLFSAIVKPASISVTGTASQGYLVKATIQRKDKNNPYHRSQVDIFYLAYHNANIPVVINVFASGFFVNLKLIALD